LQEEIYIISGGTVTKTEKSTFTGMELFVKNMVCNRCITMVKQRLDALSIDYNKVELGEIGLNKPLTDQQFSTLKDDLQQLGFELLDDRKASLVSQIKSFIVKYIHGDDDTMMSKKLSVLLAEKLSADYNYLSALFSSIEGITIEKYVILQRVERAKELLEYNELSLGEIADKLNYSSVQHLSQQFKKITGLTPSQFKQSSDASRSPLDQVGR
jgi:AraC family transcriptional regulator